MRTLEGITVVAVEQAIAAPLASRHLADLGARVIKVERPEGDFARRYDTTVNGLSSHFVWANRGKESVRLDLKDAADLEMLYALLDGADVFIQNLAPGAAERLGLGERKLRETFPRLITCSVSGYGAEGPYADKKAYDLLIQCEAGLVSITGSEDEPAKCGIPVADIAAGMYAYSGILAALLKRTATGVGSHVEVSMLEALGEWMGFPLYFAAYGKTAPARSGARHAAIAPYGPFAAADGQMFLAVQNEREWALLCTEVFARPALLEDPRFLTNMDRVAHQAALKQELEAASRRMGCAEFEQRLERFGIANARLRSIEEFISHPQLRARKRWMEVPTPQGPVMALKPVVQIDDEPPRTQAVPALGEHDETIKRPLLRRSPHPPAQ